MAKSQQRVVMDKLSSSGGTPDAQIDFGLDLKENVFIRSKT